MEGSLPVLGIHEQRWAIYSGWQTNAWAGNRIMVDIPKLLATETRRIVRRLAFLHRLDVCDLAGDLCRDRIRRHINVRPIAMALSSESVYEESHWVKSQF
jgi:hypothetical protein